MNDVHNEMSLEYCIFARAFIQSKSFFSQINQI